MCVTKSFSQVIDLSKFGERLVNFSCDLTDRIDWFDCEGVFHCAERPDRGICSYLSDGIFSISKSGMFGFSLYDNLFQ